MTNMDYNEFETLLESYLPSEGGSGKKVAGTIESKDRNFSFLDVPGVATTVRVRTEELEKYNIGDEIEVILVGETPEGEFLIGSRRRIEMESGWEQLKEAFQNNTKVTGTVIREIKGGYIVEVFAHQTFLPRSLSEARLASEIVGKEIEVLIKEAKEEKKGKKVTISRKDIVLAERNEEFSKISLGDILNGNVMEVLPFGVVVAIGKLRGFIHISEISWKKSEKIQDINVGDTLTVKVIELEEEKKNVKLSLKALTKNPWELANETFKVDDVIEGKVTKLLQYGALVEILDGVEGLVHISDLTWNKKKLSVGEFLAIGDTVKVMILELKPEMRKLKLGVKQLSIDPWNGAEASYKVGTKLSGKIAEIKPYGIFVEVEEGIDVFIHQADFAWVGTKKFEKGQVIDFEIIELDLENRKVKGSIKSLEVSPWEKALGLYQVGTIVEKPIKNIQDFGLFVNLEEGVDGFIPTQLLSKDFIKDIRAKFQVGDVITGKIIEVDKDKQKIKISIKAYEFDSERNETKELLEKYGTAGE